jgi:hypothetical protein
MMMMMFFDGDDIVCVMKLYGLAGKKSYQCVRRTY